MTKRIEIPAHLSDPFAYARKRASETGKPYGLGGLVITPNGDIARPGGGIVKAPFITGAPLRLNKRMRMHTAGCGCGQCPAPAEIAANRNVAAALGRNMVGRGGPCTYAPLSFSMVAVAAGGVGNVGNVNSTVAICPEKLVIVTTGALGFLITALRFGNRPQFAELTAGAGLHSAAFDPGAEQSIPFKGDCVDSGTPLAITATNLDGANPQSLFGFLIGPMQGM